MAIETTTDTVKSSSDRTNWFNKPAVNPILIKELRSRMRGPRAFLILTGFLILLSGLAFLLYKIMEEQMRFGGGPMSMSATIGVTMFMGIAYFTLFLVTFVTPALTAGAISSERESLTYEMLMATPLRPSSILLGKMVATLSYVFLLIFAAIPMLSLIFIFGGVTLRDMLVAVLILAVTTFTFGLIGTFWSAVLKRTGRATVISYLTLVALIIGPYIGYVFYGVLRQQAPPVALLYPSPFNAMGSVLGATVGPGRFFPFWGFFLNGPGWRPGMDFGPPAWQWTLAFYAVMSLFLAMATVVLVRPVGRRRITLPQFLVGAALVLALFGILAFFFSAEEWDRIWTSPERWGAKIPAQEAPAAPPPRPAPLPAEIEVPVQKLEATIPVEAD